MSPCYIATMYKFKKVMFPLSDKETAWFTFANIMPFIMAQKSDCSDGSTSMQIYKKKKNLWKKKNLPYFLFVNEKKNIPECYLLGWGKNYGLLQTEGDDLPVWDWNQLSVHAYFVPRGQFFKLKWPK